MQRGVRRVGRATSARSGAPGQQADGGAEYPDAGAGSGPHGRRSSLPRAGGNIIGQVICRNVSATAALGPWSKRILGWYVRGHVDPIPSVPAPRCGRRRGGRGCPGRERSQLVARPRRRPVHPDRRRYQRRLRLEPHPVGDQAGLRVGVSGRHAELRQQGHRRRDPVRRGRERERPARARRRRWRTNSSRAASPPSNTARRSSGATTFCSARTRTRSTSRQRPPTTSRRRSS